MMTLASPEHRLFVHRIAEAWAEGNEAPSQPEGTLWRGSWAGMCARKVAYMTTKQEQTDPPTTADYWRMGLGSVVHELLEPAVKRWLDNDESVTVEEEVNVEMGLHGHGHVDLVLTSWTSGEKIVLELKTINGFGYKQCVEKGEGPRHSHILQGSMYARAVEADLLVIGYLSMENIAPGRAKQQGIDDIGRFASEWHYPKDVYMPLAAMEEQRLENIALEAHKNGPESIPRRFSHSDPDIPFPAEITEPSKGLWTLDTSFGKAWQCGYCDYRTRCITDGVANE
jgi:hypothetical protein